MLAAFDPRDLEDMELQLTSPLKGTNPPEPQIELDASTVTIQLPEPTGMS